VVPEKKAALDKEVERFMNEEGLVRVDMTASHAGMYFFIQICTVLGMGIQ